MTVLCKTDADGFITSAYSAEEFSNQGDTEFPIPPGTPPDGCVWRRINDVWVAHEDLRGRMFYDPASSAGALATVTLSGLLDQPPGGWLPYGDTQREQETVSFLWAAVRKQRQSALEATDWTDTLTAKTRLGEAVYEEWQSYRQALRDITEQPDPRNIVWPVTPQSEPQGVFTVGAM